MCLGVGAAAGSLEVAADTGSGENWKWSNPRSSREMSLTAAWEASHRSPLTHAEKPLGSAPYATPQAVVLTAIPLQTYLASFGWYLEILGCFQGFYFVGNRLSTAPADAVNKGGCRRGKREKTCSTHEEVERYSEIGEGAILCISHL